MKDKYQGIYIPHRVIDADSKMIAQKSLSGWQHAELTPEQWIEKLDAGQTIQPSAFTPKSDSTFTHKVENWIETYFVCADADNIKGVEFLDDGSDKNPEGVEPWTENGLLSKKFPGLTAKVYAVGGIRIVNARMTHYTDVTDLSFFLTSPSPAKNTIITYSLDSQMSFLLFQQ